MIYRMNFGRSSRLSSTRTLQTPCSRLSRPELSIPSNDRHSDALSWISDIVRKSFVSGIVHLTDSKVLSSQYYELVEEQDPIYGALLKGLEDKQLAKTFVGYWTIGQTLASQSRFWLDHALSEILVQRFAQEGRTDVQVYPGWMLGQGYLARRLSLANLGDEQREEIVGQRVWTVDLPRHVLEKIDVLVGSHERRHTPAETESGIVTGITGLGMTEDRAELSSAIESLEGDQLQHVNLSCNLIVIEPDRVDGQPHSWAFRFVNPKVFAQPAVRKQERTNLLRLYAYLVREKILRDPREIRVYVAELLPRQVRTGGARIPSYFSEFTYMRSDELWGFLGVPFSAAAEGITLAGQELGSRLRNSLNALLPKPRMK